MRCRRRSGGSSLAPLVLFAYKRLHHLQAVLRSLQNNSLARRTDLYVFSDGPKNHSEIAEVVAVRKFLKTIEGFRSVQVICSEINKGLSRSIIEGVSHVIVSVGKLIVLEDDLVVSPSFLEFMNEALDRYENDERVISVQGYLLPLRQSPKRPFFLRGADCWGWGTWERGWRLFQSDARLLLRELKRRHLLRRFDFGGAFPYSEMLKRAIRGRVDSWAIRWYASALLADKLTLYPHRSLVRNIGMDASGIHSPSTTVYDSPLAVETPSLDGLPVEESKEMYEAFQNFFRHVLMPAQRQERRVRVYQRWRSALKSAARTLLPPLLFETLMRLRHGRYAWFGDFSDWRQASAFAKGYDARAILERVHTSALKVRDGLALYERDGVLFYKDEGLNFPLLASLLYVAASRKKRLHVLDFGGAFGSVYFRYCRLLQPFLATWNVVEQPAWVEVGKRDFSGPVLRFYKSVRQCLKSQTLDVVLFSGVLQYLEFPFAVMEEVVKFGIPYVILDRTPMWAGESHRLTIQKVDPKIYPGSYPCWIFSRGKFLATVYRWYDLCWSFGYQDSSCRVNGRLFFRYEGMLLRRLLS